MDVVVETLQVHVLYVERLTRTTRLSTINPVRQQQLQRLLRLVVRILRHQQPRPQSRLKMLLAYGTTPVLAGVQEVLEAQ
jgi:hypothetical protein